MPGLWPWALGLVPDQGTLPTSLGGGGLSIPQFHLCGDRSQAACSRSLRGEAGLGAEVRCDFSGLPVLPVW